MKKVKREISIIFDNQEDFLKAFNKLYKNGFKMFIEISQYENAILLKGIYGFDYLKAKEALNILKKLKKKDISLRIEKTETEIIRSSNKEIYKKGFKI